MKITIEIVGEAAIIKTDTDRQTFEVPAGSQAVRDGEGRATGETTPDSLAERLDAIDRANVGYDVRWVEWEPNTPGDEFAPGHVHAHDGTTKGGAGEKGNLFNEPDPDALEIDTVAWAKSFVRANLIDGKGVTWTSREGMERTVGLWFRQLLDASERHAQKRLEMQAAKIGELVRDRDNARQMNTALITERDNLAALLKASRIERDKTQSRYAAVETERNQCMEIMHKLYGKLGVTAFADALTAIERLQSKVPVWNKEARNKTFVKAVLAFHHWLDPSSSTIDLADQYLRSENFDAAMIADVKEELK